MWKRNSLPPSATAPGLLASLHRKLRVSSDADSLYLRPFTTDAEEDQTSYTGSAVRLKYGRRPTPQYVDRYEERNDDFLLSDGVVGLLRGPGNSASFRLSLRHDTADDNLTASRHISYTID